MAVDLNLSRRTLLVGTTASSALAATGCCDPCPKTPTVVVGTFPDEGYAGEATLLPRIIGYSRESLDAAKARMQRLEEVDGYRQMDWMEIGVGNCTYWRVQGTPIQSQGNERVVRLTPFQPAGVA